MTQPATRRVAAALVASMALAGCGPGEQIMALQAENDQLREQAEDVRARNNELLSALGEIRMRIDDIRGNMRLGTYSRYGRNLSKDLDDLAARANDLESKSTGPEPERSEPRNP